MTDKEFEEITGEKIPNASDPSQLQPTLAEQMDSTPKTGDKSQMVLWLMLMIFSIVIMIIATGIMIAPNLKKVALKRK